MLKYLEQTVTRMTGRSPREIRQAPLPRFSGTAPGFISRAQVNRTLDRALRPPDNEELKNLGWIAAALLGILTMAYLVSAMSVPVNN
jgi:hypothetical protein